MGRGKLLGTVFILHSRARKLASKQSMFHLNGKDFSIDKGLLMGDPVLGMFRIFETETFLASLEQNFEGQKNKIKLKLRTQVYQQLQESPLFGPNIKKLRNWTPPTWRYQIGSYRFFYEIDNENKIIFMLLAEYRGKGYKK
jgi:mRNA interferase RelE/StbE